MATRARLEELIYQAHAADSEDAGEPYPEMARLADVHDTVD